MLPTRQPADRQITAGAASLGLLRFPSCWCRNGNLFFSNDLILLRASGDISTTVNSISVTEGSAKCWIVFICGGWRFSFLSLAQDAIADPAPTL